MVIPESNEHIQIAVVVVIRPGVRQGLRRGKKCPARTLSKAGVCADVYYREIVTGDYCVDRIVSDIRQAGFQVAKSYRVFEYPYHHFFVLKKG